MEIGIITGCSRGIGFATSKLLASNDNIKVIGTSTSGKCCISQSNFECLPLNLSENSSIFTWVFTKHFEKPKSIHITKRNFKEWNKLNEWNKKIIELGN